MSNFGVSFLLLASKGNKGISIEDNIGEEIHIHFDHMRLMFRNAEFKDLSEKALSMIANASGISIGILEKLEPIFLFDLAKRNELISLKLYDEEYVALKDLYVPVSNFLGVWSYRSIKHSEFLKIIRGKQKKTIFDKGQVNYIHTDNLSRTNDVLKECKNDKNICDRYPLFVTRKNLIRDGQHRAAALYYLYGKNYKVKVQRMYTDYEIGLNAIKERSVFKTALVMGGGHA